jgi:hypothetical protein
MESLERNMSTTTSIPYRPKHSLDEQKGEIEEILACYLSDEADLSNRQKYLLQNALGHTYRGLFGMARQDIQELWLPESTWSRSAVVTGEMVTGVNRQTLRRALAYLRGAPAQSPPVFG